MRGCRAVTESAPPQAHSKADPSGSDKVPPCARGLPQSIRVECHPGSEARLFSGQPGHDGVARAVAGGCQSGARAGDGSARGRARGRHRRAAGGKKKAHFFLAQFWYPKEISWAGSCVVVFLIPRESELDSEGIKFDSEGIYYLTEGGERGVIDENEAPCEGSGFTACQ